MSTITWTVEADWDRDGTYTDVTTYVESPGSGVRSSRGMSAMGVYRASRCNFAFSNRDARFTRGNTAGAYYGLLRPGVPVRIRALLLGLSYTVWTGYLQRPKSSWQTGAVATTDYEAVDLADYLATSVPINLTVSTSRTTSTAAVAALVAAGLTSTQYVVDVGQQALSVHYARAQTALAAVLDAVRSEMGSMFYVQADGRPRIESRKTRLGISPARQTSLRRGPVGYWRLGEWTGSSAADESGNGNTGTITIGAGDLNTAGLLGASDPDGCIDFDALVTKVQAADATTIQNVFDGGGSLAVLISPDTDGELDTGIIASKAGWTLSVANDSGTVMRLIWTVDFSGAADGVWQTAVDIPRTTTTHIVVSYNADATTNDPTIYINGTARTIAAGTLTETSTPVGARVTDVASVFVIGNNTGQTRTFDGRIDEVRLYTAALEAEEAYDLYSVDTNGRTWGDGTVIFPNAIEAELAEADLISSVTVRSTVFTTSQVADAKYQFPRNAKTRPTATSIALASNTPYEWQIAYNGLTTQITTPVATTDYTANDNAAGTSADRTSSLTVTVTDLGAGFTIRIVNALATTVYLTKFQLRIREYILTSESPSFVAAKPIAWLPIGRGADIGVPFVEDSAQARDWAVTLLRTYRYEYDRLKLSFTVGNDTARAALLAVELGDIVRYKDTGITTKGSYSDDWYYVEGINIDVPPTWAGQSFRATVTLAPTYLYRHLTAIAWDDFIRANLAGDLTTSTSGDVWANDTGFDIATNAARPNSALQQTPDIDVGVRDMVVEVSLANMSADVDEQVGVHYRKSDASNYYRAVVDDGDNTVKLIKRVAGVETTVASAAWTVTDTAEIRAMVQGTRHRVWLDGILKLDATDTALQTATKAGLASLNTTVVTFDDFYSGGISAL